MFGARARRLLVPQRTQEGILAIILLCVVPWSPQAACILYLVIMLHTIYTTYAVRI